MFKYILLLSIFLNISIFANTSYAQIGNLSEDIIVDISPEYPRPDSRVFISIESYATNLNSAYIDWVVDGKTALKGTGQKKLNINLNKKNVNVSIKITTVDGRYVEKSFPIIPSKVDLLWEADTYTPPFFKGKPLFTRQSTVYVYANPVILDSGTEIPKEKLLYRWSNNGKAMDSVSGYGRYYVQINSGILGREMQIEVEVEDPKTGQVAYNTINISPAEPLVYIYEKDPLLGVKLQKAIDSIKIEDSNEKELQVIPYFFSIKNPLEVDFIWSINGRGVDDGINTETRVFRKIENVFGKANVNVSVSNNSRIMQGGQSSVIIDFSNSENLKLDDSKI